MPTYAYVTQSAKGAPFSKSRADAASLSELNARLFHLNKPVVKILDRERKNDRRQRRIPTRLKLTFLEQLEASCHLGMDLRTALGICFENVSKRTSAGRHLSGCYRRIAGQSHARDLICASHRSFSTPVRRGLS